MLSKHELNKFHTEGFIHVSNVFEYEDAIEFQNEIWQELEEEFGIIKDDRSTWRTPPHSPRKTKFSETNNKVISKNFRSIIDQLLGSKIWEDPKSWGGFLITFPTQDIEVWQLTHNLWHWDYELYRQFELKGLLIFSFYSEVGPQGGGTLAVSGSHRLLEHFYRSLNDVQKAMSHSKQRKLFFNHYPWFRKLSNEGSMPFNRISYFMKAEHEIEGIDLKVVEFTGNPGDVVFCHPRLIHAPAAINLSNHPRIMRVKFLW